MNKIPFKLLYYFIKTVSASFSSTSQICIFIMLNTCIHCNFKSATIPVSSVM